MEFITKELGGGGQTSEECQQYTTGIEGCTPEKNHALGIFFFNNKAGTIKGKLSEVEGK